jgi:hypothetical protein
VPAGYYTSEQIEGALGTVFGVDSQLILDQTYFVAENNHQQLLVAVVGVSVKRFMEVIQAKIIQKTACSTQTATRQRFVHSLFIQHGHVEELEVRLCEYVNWLLSVLDLRKLR